MKQLKNFYLLAGIIISSSTVLAQIDEGSIKYKVDLLDEFTGLPVENLMGKIDWQFEITFSMDKSSVYEQFTTEKNTTYLHNKESGIVLSLHHEFGKKFLSYSQSQGNSIKHLGHNYGDTIVTKLEETKKILGYNCQKIVLDLGSQVKATFWVTDEIEIGTIVPGSPLALNHPALEYTFEGTGMKEHFVATEIETTVSDYSTFEEYIPSDFNIIVPMGIYDQNEFIQDSTKVEHSEFNFISYPKHPDGLKYLYDLFKELPAYASQKEDFMEGEDGEPVYLGPSSILISFIVDLEGNLSDISVLLAPNKEIEIAAKEIMGEMPRWLPATIWEEPVSADMNLTITLPIGK